MFKVTLPEVPPPSKPVPAVTAVISPTGTPATALSTYNLLAASVSTLTVSTPCILPVPPSVISPPETTKSPEIAKDPVEAVNLTSKSDVCSVHVKILTNFHYAVCSYYNSSSIPPISILWC